MCMPEQCLSKSAIMSLECLWGSAPAGKVQDLSTAKQSCLFGKIDSIKITQKQHVCDGGCGE